MDHAIDHHQLGTGTKQRVFTTIAACGKTPMIDASLRFTQPSTIAISIYFSGTVRMVIVLTNS
jgi:hypothetical protein